MARRARTLALAIVTAGVLAGCGGGGGRDPQGGGPAGGSGSTGGGSGGGGSGGGGSVPLGTNADLSTLALDGVPFDQIFQTGQPSYSARVGYLRTSVDLSASTADAAAALALDDAPFEGDARLPLAEGDNTFEIEVTAEDGTTTSVYSLTVTREALAGFAQNAYVKASNTGEEDGFGLSVALDGNTLAVGAPNEDSAAAGIDNNQLDNSATDAGAVYVFTRDSAGVWTQQAYLKASNPDSLDGFGGSVALDGDTLAVGAPRDASGFVGGEEGNGTVRAGAVHVFSRAAGSWSQTALLNASNAEATDYFGFSVALSGDTLAVGALGEDGVSIGVNRDEDNNDAYESGAAYVFVRDDDGAWTQQAYVKASNTSTFYQFGWSVALSDDTLVVGSRHEGTGGPNVGAAYVFARDAAGTWSQEGFLKASNAGSGDYFGESVAVFGDTIAVGAPLEDADSDSNPDFGAVYIFVRDETGAWIEQVYLPSSPSRRQSRFGHAVALARDALLVGMPYQSGQETGVHASDQGTIGASSSGAAYLYLRDTAGAWQQQAYIKASNTGRGDRFGTSVAISADALVIGAERESSAATGVGQGEMDDSAPGAGAVYVFD